MISNETVYKSKKKKKKKVDFPVLVPVTIDWFLYRLLLGQESYHMSTKSSFLAPTISVHRHIKATLNKY